MRRGEVARERARPSAAASSRRLRGRRARARSRAARGVADVRRRRRRPDRRRDGRPDRRARPRHPPATSAPSTRAPRGSCSSRRPTACSPVPAVAVGEGRALAATAGRDAVLGRTVVGHRRRRRRSSDAAGTPSGSRRAPWSGPPASPLEPRRRAGRAHRRRARPRRPRDGRAGSHAARPSRGLRARRHGPRTRRDGSAITLPGVAPVAMQQGATRRGRSAPAWKPPPRRRSGTATRATSRRSAAQPPSRTSRASSSAASRLDDLARRPPLLPDRLPEPAPDLNHPSNIERRDYLQVEKDAWAKPARGSATSRSRSSATSTRPRR